MAILVDWSNVASAALFVGNSRDDTSTTSSQILLGKIRQYNTMFRKEFGELILCADANSWRHKVFPHYKARRRAERVRLEALGEGGDHLRRFDDMHSFWDIMVEHSPFRCLKIRGAEGDDLVAIIARTPGKHVVISADADISQLTRFQNVKCYQPITKKFIDNGADYWHRKIVYGDGGDDIPNILMPDDTFIDPARPRQKSITQKIVNHIVESDDPLEAIDTLKVNGVSNADIKRNYLRNKQLIDLTQMPESLRQLVLARLNDPAPKGDLMQLVTALKSPFYITKLDDFVPVRENWEESLF
jgi:hypothetical protein